MTATPMPERVGLGVVGLGRAFTLMLPALRADPRFALVAAADTNTEPLARFATEFAENTYADAAALAADPAVQAVYVATPHQCHAADAIAAANAGRHVLVEKPMALSLDEAAAMVAAARRNNVQLIVGPSHSFDAPIQLAHRLIASERYGKLRMLQLSTYTDFLYRPRRPEELDTERGGGAVFNQAAHQIDIARLLCGGRLVSLRAHTAAWDAARPTEGAYSALLSFAGGAFASLTYSGYGHYDSDALNGWIGEDGRRKDKTQHGAARRRLAAATTPAAEAALRSARGYGTAGTPSNSPVAHPQFGLLIASCEHADLVPTPAGVEIHADTAHEFIAARAPFPPRKEVLDALFDAVVLGRSPTQTGEWGLATLEACLAMLQSSREGCEISLHHQVPA